MASQINFFFAIIVSIVVFISFSIVCEEQGTSPITLQDRELQARIALPETQGVQDSELQAHIPLPKLQSMQDSEVSETEQKRNKRNDAARELWSY